MQNLDAKIESLVQNARNGDGVEALAAAFAPVANPIDWRFGVNAVITGKLSDDDYAMTMASIAFFTCGVPCSIREADKTEFYADGYAMNFWHDTTAVSYAEAEMVANAASAAGFAVKALQQAA